MDVYMFTFTDAEHKLNYWSSRFKAGKAHLFFLFVIWIWINTFFQLDPQTLQNKDWQRTVIGMNGVSVPVKRDNNTESDFCFTASAVSEREMELHHWTTV